MLFLFADCDSICIFIDCDSLCTSTDYDSLCKYINYDSTRTWADDAGILVVSAVVLTPAQVEAEGKLRLLARTRHIVQQDGDQAVAEESLVLGLDGGSAAQLSAHHQGIEHVPLVITHRPPEVFVAHLHPALAAAVPVHHPDGRPDCTGTNTNLLLRQIPKKTPVTTRIKVEII